MSTSKGSDTPGLRFGVEIELVVKSKNRPHTTFQSLALDICRHLGKAKVPSHVARLSQKADAAETYQDWTIIEDSTLPSNQAENFFGVELVSPIFYLQQPQIWIPQIQETWRILQREFEVHATKECSTHVHLSPANRLWTLREAKGIAKAAVFFERCIDALMPGHRRINPYCMSNRWNPGYSGRSMPQIFSDISQAESSENLGERMCWCSKDSVHAFQTLHEDDFVHPHFRWNFTALTERTRTIEFRQPPASRDAGQTVTWILLAASFAQWASERADLTLDPARTANLEDLHRCLMAGARVSGVSDNMLGLLEALFRGVKRLPVPRYNLKSMTQEEQNGLRREATRMGIPFEKYKELFAYE
ncbi:putative amidoligase enzyme-domain-containing protein [Corynascus novoguineensis]|uniref:Amidoligase enzyme-domain-containing protein n=1 Tax=Corynascus novoguineensis TaxID=1126955 RepID=A0AAN7CMH8_9PEZI|nr:putative amidoligase enzyme-domain-containing protein [Corynascus novoguineensis]